MESKRPVWESEEVRVALLSGPDHLRRLGAESVNPYVMRPAARLFAVRTSVQFPPLTEHLGRIPGQPGRLAKRYLRSPGSGFADRPAKALRALVKHEADDEDPVRLPSPRPINSTTKSHVFTVSPRYRGIGRESRVLAIVERDEVDPVLDVLLAPFANFAAICTLPRELVISGFTGLRSRYRRRPETPRAVWSLPTGSVHTRRAP
jgi:hypothetical protein